MLWVCVVADTRAHVRVIRVGKSPVGVQFGAVVKHPMISMGWRFNQTGVGCSGRSGRSGELTT